VLGLPLRLTTTIGSSGSFEPTFRNKEQADFGISLV